MVTAKTFSTARVRNCRSCAGTRPQAFGTNNTSAPCIASRRALSGNSLSAQIIEPKVTLPLPPPMSMEPVKKLRPSAGIASSALQTQV